MTDVMIDFVWRPALERARRGEPADLAALVCHMGPWPDDDELRRDVELILANPVHKRPGHRQRALGDSQIALARLMFETWTTDTSKPMRKGIATQHIARLMGVEPGTMADCIARRGAYADG